MPRGAHLAFRVAGFEQTEQLRFAVRVEAFVGHHQQLATPIERIICAAAMAEGVVLDASADLIQLRVRQLHDVEWVSDLGCVGKHRVEHGPIRAGQIQRRPPDQSPPLRGALTEPLARPGTVSARHDIQQHATGDIHDRRRPALLAPRPDVVEHRLVEAERSDLTDPLGVVVNERCAVRDQGVVDRVPVAAELDCDLVHGSPATADLARDPPAGAVGQRLSRCGDPGVFAGPRLHRTRPVRALPAMLAPPQTRWATERGEIDELDLITIFDPASRAAPETRRSRTARLDMYLERVAGDIDNAENGDIGQANEQLADASRVTFQQGLPNSTM